MSSQIQILTAEKERLRSENAKLIEALEILRKESTQLQKDFEAYRQNYKTAMRTRGVGLNLGTLVVNGTTFQDVVCRQITEEYLSVMHGTGPAKFTWDKVPALVRAKFGIEKPGEFPQRNFENAAPVATTLSYDLEVGNFDKAMVDSMVKYQKLSRERSDLALEIMKLRSALAIQKRKGGETTELTMKINIADVEAAKIHAELNTIRLYQNGLLTKDPRRKKKVIR